jgi:hypothetical protein
MVVRHVPKGWTVLKKIQNNFFNNSVMVIVGYKTIKFDCN